MLQIVSTLGEKNTLGEQNDARGADDHRLRGIESVTDAALAYLDVEDLLVELLDRVRELLEVDTATVLLLDPSSQQLAVTANRGVDAGGRQGLRIPVGKGFAGRVAAEMQPVIIERVDHTNVLHAIFRQYGVCSLLGVPLLSKGTVIGVLHVGTLVPRRFTGEDVRLLQVVAERVGSAIQLWRAEVERAVAAVLQRSLLPARLPVVPGLELAARYVAASMRITLSGETDLANAGAIEDAIRGAGSRQLDGVSVDLTDLTYMDSAGMRILFSLASRLQALRIVLELIVPLDSSTRRLIELSGFESLAALRPA
ncbi:MAG: GAF domain-containing protein [Pseudonocardiaceae bacterium]